MKAYPDFSWLQGEGHKVGIVHRSSVQTLSDAELKIYVETLWDAVHAWDNDPKLSLEVFFLDSDQKLIEEVISMKG